MNVTTKVVLEFKVNADLMFDKNGAPIIKRAYLIYGPSAIDSIPMSGMSDEYAIKIHDAVIKHISGERYEI